MKKTSIALAALVTLGVTGSAYAAPLAPAKPMQSFAADNGRLEHVDWRWGGRCKAWRHECADRWGWGTWKFRRCLLRHGCL